MRSVEAGAPVFQPNVDSRSPPHARFYSPPLKEETSLQVTAQAEVRAEHSNLQSLLSPRVSLQPKVVFHFSTSNPTPTVPPLKMTGKRLRTNEEETEYSSKHSQVIFKSSFEVPDNSSWATFQKSKEGHNQVSFKQAS